MKFRIFEFNNNKILSINAFNLQFVLLLNSLKTH